MSRSDLEARYETHVSQTGDVYFGATRAIECSGYDCKGHGSTPIDTFSTIPRWSSFWDTVNEAERDTVS